MTITEANAGCPVAVAAAGEPSPAGAIAGSPDVVAGGTTGGTALWRVLAAARPRRRLLALLTGCAVVLVPWTGYLAATLPARHTTGQWKFAWVGFDVALLICLAAAAWLGWRRRRAAVPALVATAALLLADAWFDVLLDWGGADPLDGWTSLAMAVLVEIPLAVFLLLRARLLLPADAPATGEHLPGRSHALPGAPRG